MNGATNSFLETDGVGGEAAGPASFRQVYNLTMKAPPLFSSLSISFSFTPSSSITIYLTSSSLTPCSTITSAEYRAREEMKKVYALLGWIVEGDVAGGVGDGGVVVDVNGWLSGWLIGFGVELGIMVANLVGLDARKEDADADFSGMGAEIGVRACSCVDALRMVNSSNVHMD